MKLVDFKAENQPMEHSRVPSMHETLRLWKTWKWPQIGEVEVSRL